jgi:hypothetical protein
MLARGGEQGRMVELREFKRLREQINRFLAGCTPIPTLQRADGLHTETCTLSQFLLRKSPSQSVLPEQGSK